MSLETDVKDWIFETKAMLSNLQNSHDDLTKNNFNIIENINLIQKQISHIIKKFHAKKPIIHKPGNEFYFKISEDFLADKLNPFVLSLFEPQVSLGTPSYYITDREKFPKEDFVSYEKSESTLVAVIPHLKNKN